MRTLLLREYATTERVPLSVEQRDALLELLPSVRLSPSVGSEGCYDLTPAAVIGALELPELSIVIRPKLEIEKVLFLISYSIGGMQVRLPETGLVPDASLLEAVVPGFVEQVNRALSRGVLQGYREEEDSLATVRGRIRFDDQIRNRYGVAPPIEVRFDEFTEDILPNRLLKAAFEVLGWLRLRSPISRHALRSFDNALANVRLLHYSPKDIPEVRYDRLNLHYRPAAELARMILRWTSYELRHGQVATAGFLVDMNRVFEDFVYTALRESLHLTEREFPLGGGVRRLRLDAAGKIPLKPDLSWWRGTTCLWVGDAKYKRADSGQVPNADLYQALAYATALGLPSATLIYAAGEREPATHVVLGADKRLHVMTVDLRGSPAEILATLDTIAEHVREIRLGRILAADVTAASRVTQRAWLAAGAMA